MLIKILSLGPSRYIGSLVPGGSDAIEIVSTFIATEVSLAGMFAAVAKPSAVTGDNGIEVLHPAIKTEHSTIATCEDRVEMFRETFLRQ